MSPEVLPSREPASLKDSDLGKWIRTLELWNCWKKCLEK